MRNGGKTSRVRGGSASSGSDGVPFRKSTTAIDHPELDLEFEWLQLCHACGERKRFSAAICGECRRRHDV